MNKLRIPFAQYVAIFVVAGLGFVTEVLAQEKILVWNGEAVAKITSSVVQLRNGPNGEVVATVNTETLRRIVEVKNRIAGAANQPAHLYVLSGTEPNAMASKKDGSPKIAINVAMINLLGDDYDAYAAIIGHELAHLVRSHGATREGREGARSVISSVFGTILGHFGIPLGGAIANFGTTAVSKAFSRDEEREADNLGLGYMKQAGYDPMGAVRAWERMGMVAKSRGFPFLSTHPAPEERLETMRTLAQSHMVPSLAATASPVSGSGAPSTAANASPALDGVNRDSSFQAGQTSARPRDNDAVRLLRRSADQGNAEAQMNLGAMYALGRGGLPKDDAEAVRLYRLAADQGNAQGQALLGFEYLLGKGGLPKDDIECVRLFRLSANQGNPNGQFGLGFIHEYGRAGMAKDTETAIYWYRLAAQQGLLGATASLKRLEKQ